VIIYLLTLCGYCIYYVYMDASVINIRTDARLKLAAQRVAEDLGFNLSSLINAYLKNLVKTKTVYYSNVEEPSEYLKSVIREAEEDLRLGKTYSFKSADEASEWLKKNAS